MKCSPLQMILLTQTRSTSWTSRCTFKSTSESKAKKVDFHLSYPWQIKGEAIGFLDQFKALKDLTSNKKVFDKYGNVGGQPLQVVMPVFDKLNPTLYMH